MNERWVCKRCFADNEESSSACQRCGLIRGAESSPADQADWASASESAAPDAGPRGGLGKWLRLWWIPALAVVLVVGYLVSARRDDQGQLQNAATVGVDDLRAGDCFDVGDEVEISDVDGVPCGEAHEFQVFHIQEHETETLPSDAELDAVFLTICGAPFEEFVGTPYATSELYGSMITPSESSFADGDRMYICVLYDRTNAELTSSMEGSNR